MSEAPRRTSEIEMLATEEAVHDLLGEWIKGHLDNDRMTLLDYNRVHYPFQRLDVPCYGPTEPSVAPIQASRAIMGPAFDELVDEMRAHVPIVKSRLANGENTLIITPHLENVLDTPITEAALFCAYEDDGLSRSNMILTGKVITRLALFGAPAVEAMAPMGRVYMNVPRSPGAHKAGLDDLTIDAINWPMIRQVKRDIRDSEGKVIHQAPSNGRAEHKLGVDEVSYLVVPRVDDTTAKLIASYRPLVIPVALRVGNNPVESNWAMGQPEYVNEAGDIHFMMEEMASISDGLFADRSVIYSPSEQEQQD